MKKEKIEVTKYLCDYENEMYIIYIIPDGEISSFYIQKEDYGSIFHNIGIDVKKLDITVEEFISENLNEWVQNYNADVKALENVYEQ